MASCTVSPEIVEGASGEVGPQMLSEIILK